MSFRRSALETLPDDGVVLDELISDLKTEYGIPATPQEYRLFIKIPVVEEASEKIVETVRVDPRDEEANVDGEPPKTRRRRRGRRRRRPGFAETDAPGAAEEGPQDADGSPEAGEPEGGTI